MPRHTPGIDALEPRRLLATLPAGFAEQTITTFADQPTSQVFTPDGRLFVTLEGTNDTSGPADVRVIKDGAVLATPLLTVTTQSFFERGLLGIALHPSFSSNGFVYVYYTVPTAQTPTLTHRVERWTVPSGSDVANPATRVTIFDIAVPVGQGSPGNHNGGAMAFGPDGKLYIAVGDNATSSNGQTLGTLFGKMLRINEDGSIPTNPFDSLTTGLNKAIYSLGLRNPFTFAFDPGTSKFHINDVGSSGGGRREEVNVGTADSPTGINYGWPGIEGFRVAQPLPSIGTYRDPIHAYTDGFAITGGAFYNPSTPMFPSQFIGQYFFGDYVSGTIRRINPNATPPIASTGYATGASGPVDLDVSPIDGALWYIEYTSRTVKRVFVNTSLLPLINDQPESQTVSLEEPVTFTVGAAGAGLSYQWQQNQVNIPGATQASYTLKSPIPDDNGDVFRVIVTNVNGSVASSGATLTVLNNLRPDPVIGSPDNGTTFVVGTPISFSGFATDREDGDLDVTALHWEVSYRTGQVDRNPILVLDDVGEGSFVPEIVASYTDPTVLYFIDLTATDSAGTFRTVRVTLVPVVADVTLTTNVPGLTLGLDDGSQVVAPINFTGIAGFQRAVEAPLNQVLGTQTYQFQNWSDGGAASHFLVTPLVNSTFTATYADISSPLVSNGQFEFNNLFPAPPHQVRLTFTEDIGASISAADVVVTRLEDSSVIPTAATFLSYDSGTNTATLSFPGVPNGDLEDGNYRAVLAAGSVQDGTGNALAADFTVNFFVFAGDANHDRSIDIGDFSTLGVHFNDAGTFSAGDFNYDGGVDIADFSILGSKFNATLPALRPARTAAMPPGQAGENASVFGALPVSPGMVDEIDLDDAARLLA